jgi:hypothetical protein
VEPSKGASPGDCQASWAKAVPRGATRSRSDRLRAGGCPMIRSVMTGIQAPDDACRVGLPGADGSSPRKPAAVASCSSLAVLRAFRRPGTASSIAAISSGWYPGRFALSASRRLRELLPIDSCQCVLTTPGAVARASTLGRL